MSRPSNQNVMHKENKAEFAALNEKVLGLEGDFQALRHDLSTGLSSLRTDFVNSFNLINQKLDARDVEMSKRGDKKWIWAPALGVVGLILSVIGGLGLLSLNPIKDNITTLTVALKDNKDDREKAILQSIERDRRIWDHALKMRSDFDYLSGRLNPLK